jgi:hypothetical protein
MDGRRAALTCQQGFAPIRRPSTAAGEEEAAVRRGRLARRDNRRAPGWIFPITSAYSARSANSAPAPRRREETSLEFISQAAGAAA